MSSLGDQVLAGRGPRIVDTPTLVGGEWHPVRRARRRPAPRDVELANSLADARSVARIQRAADAARTATRNRRPAPPARREEPAVYSGAHDYQREAARQAVRPPSAEQERAARLFKLGHLDGVAPEPAVESEDDFRARFPYGAGFDRFGRQLPSTADPDHSRAMLRQHEAARASGYTDEASDDARAFVAALFDRDLNIRPGAPVYIGHQMDEVGQMDDPRAGRYRRGDE